MKDILLTAAVILFMFTSCNQKTETIAESVKQTKKDSAFNPAMEPVGGQPTLDSKPSVSDFNYQVKYQRAFEAALWAMPAVAIYRFRAAAFERLGLKDNDVIVYSTEAKPNLEALTANSATPYIAAYSDLSKGATVLEVPEANAAGSLYGQVVDHLLGS